MKFTLIYAGLFANKKDLSLGCWPFAVNLETFSVTQEATGAETEEERPELLTAS